MLFPAESDLKIHHFQLQRGRNALSPDYNLQKIKQANRRSYSAENKTILMNEGFSPAMMAQMSKMMNNMTENINKSFKVQITQMKKKNAS